MKISINGAETQDPSFQGETLEEVMNAIVKSRQTSYLRRVWVDGQDAKEYLEKLISGFQKAADLFRMGNEQEANQYYLQVLDGIEWFSQVITLIFSTQENKFEEKSLEKRQKQLTDLMAQMLEANQNQDWVLMADLMEYEMIPFYKVWQEVLSKIEA